jgi:hypothetical protein
MVVPWTGFPLKSLVDLARPLSSAKFVQMETFMDPKMAPEQNGFWPWPSHNCPDVGDCALDVAELPELLLLVPLVRDLDVIVGQHLDRLLHVLSVPRGDERLLLVLWARRDRVRAGRGDPVHG